MKTIKGKTSTFSAKSLIIILLMSILIGIILDAALTFIEKKLYPRKYTEYVEKYSDAYGVPEDIIYAVIRTESSFDKNAISSASTPAHGLMQLTEETYFWIAEMLGENPSAFDIYDPETNIKYGVYYLSFLYNRYKIWDTAFAAYNAGPGNVDKWLEDSNISDGEGSLTSIPFKETRNYVKKVNRSTQKYDKLYY